MTVTPRDELLDTLTAAILADPFDSLSKWERTHDASHLRHMLDEITEGWDVRRKDYPHADDHPLSESRYGHALVATGPFIPETDAERTERELRHEAYFWEPDDGPPPVRVGIRQLLRQDEWWRMNATPERQEGDNRTVAIRVEDMTHNHRLALLTWLRGKAHNLHNSAFAELMGAPDDVWASHERENPHEWLEEQELIQALVHWTTPYGEAPLTWHPASEHPHRFVQVMARWAWAANDPSEPLVRVYWSDQEWDWCAAGGNGPLADPIAEWRELYPEEKPPPFDPNCPHGVDDDDHCPECCA